MKKKTKKSSVNKEKIRKSMSFGEIIGKYPEVVEILMNKGMHCIGCAMSSYESLEQGALMHGLNPDKLVNELNDKIKK